MTSKNALHIIFFMSVNENPLYIKDLEDLEKNIKSMLEKCQGKNEKKRANMEAEKMRQELFSKYQSLTNDSVIVEISNTFETKINPVASEPEPEKKKKSHSKNQRERKLKEKYEQSRLIDESISLMTPGQIETEALQRQLEQAKMTIRHVAGDGHCLFRSIASSLSFIGRNEFKNPITFFDLRQIASNEIRKSPSFYCDQSEFNTEEKILLHCDLVEKTAEWGSSVDIAAISNALHITIIVHILNQEPMKFGDFPKSINLSLHFKYTYSGAHYNYVVPLSWPH